jgi:hypothetical protein
VIFLRLFDGRFLRVENGTTHVTKHQTQHRDPRQRKQCGKAPTDRIVRGHVAVALLFDSNNKKNDNAITGEKPLQVFGKTTGYRCHRHIEGENKRTMVVKVTTAK